MVRELVAHAAGFGFVSIINHLGTEGDLVSGVVDAICTADESSTSRESLDRLREALLQACGEVEKAPRAQDRVEMLRSAARYQFGPEGGVLLDDATVVGKYPYLKVMDGKEQLAMLTPDRGMLSLTMDGASVCSATAWDGWRWATRPHWKPVRGAKDAMSLSGQATKRSSSATERWRASA